MKNNKEVPKLGKKGTLAGLVLCFVAMITLVGAYTFSQYQNDTSNQFAEIEPQEEVELSEADPADDTEVANGDQISNEIVEEITEEITEEIAEEIAETSTEEITSTTNASIEEQILFTEDSSMIWPINGGVIMHFSTDQAIYFETLDQYKLNTAMIIDGEVGTEVLAGEIGIVESITEEAQTGTTVTIDMGNGYTAIYGQLADVKVTEGSIVERGQIIGTLAEPTIYYSVEGCNLYFQLLVDGEPVNPFMYME